MRDGPTFHHAVMPRCALLLSRAPSIYESESCCCCSRHCDDMRWAGVVLRRRLTKSLGQRDSRAFCEITESQAKVKRPGHARLETRKILVQSGNDLRGREKPLGRQDSRGRGERASFPASRESDNPVLEATTATATRYDSCFTDETDEDEDDEDGNYDDNYDTSAKMDARCSKAPHVYRTRILQAVRPSDGVVAQGSVQIGRRPSRSGVQGGRRGAVGDMNENFNRTALMHNGRMFAAHGHNHLHHKPVDTATATFATPRHSSSRPSSTWAAAPHTHRRFIGPCVIIDKHTRDTDPASLPQKRRAGGSVGLLSLPGLGVWRGPGEAQGESNGRIMQLNVPNRRLTPVDKYTGINILGSG
ncbi:hypothetical protein E2C01_056048 [Portunus trituberculatus]|uniref:Uncharacterized protein n=1 Tax=Portunus trituberculatus TaxID=210409 RepID=A0A5B7GWT7_PORTR|nr:hypothetical protein [Portunus trituberculatus]